MLCGSGELGKEVVIELQRYGVEVIALDAYANAPAHQVADRSHVVSMLDGDSLREIILKEKPDLVVPEVEAIATDVLAELEEEDVVRCGDETTVVDIEGLGFEQLVSHAPAPAIAEDDEAALDVVSPEEPSEELMAAIRYTTRLPHDDQIVAVIRELPPNILLEQVALYKSRDMTTAVAERPGK